MWFFNSFSLVQYDRLSLSRGGLNSFHSLSDKSCTSIQNLNSLNQLKKVIPGIRTFDAEYSTLENRHFKELFEFPGFLIIILRILFNMFTGFGDDSCPFFYSISEINLSHTLINDSTFETIVLRCPNICKISMKDCRNITDVSLRFFKLNYSFLN